MKLLVTAPQGVIRESFLPKQVRDRLESVAEVPAAASEVLILTVLIWVISSAIFSAIYLAAAEEADVPIMVR